MGQDGEWAIHVWQRENGQEKLVVERRLNTDKALTLDMLRQGGAPVGDQHFVQAVTLDPAQPVAGEPATISIVMWAAPPARLAGIPVLFADDVGTHDLGTVADPGPGQTATLQWTPEHAASGTITTLDQTVPVTIVDAMPPADAADPLAAGSSLTTDENAETP